MPVAIHNFDFSYQRKGKPVFVPTSTGRRIGREIKAKVKAAYEFGPTFFHLAQGGHVAAMHHHRDNAFFCRIDIERFFYSVSRRRVQSALDRIGVGTARHYAKWSTVSNPYGDPAFAVPYGFVQSPILASLVLATSDTGAFLANLPQPLRASVYMDDIVISGGTEADLREIYEATIDLLSKDGFQANADKLRPPSAEIDVFNCDLAKGYAAVSEGRREEFYSVDRSPASAEAFEAYRESVERGNTDSQA